MKRLALTFGFLVSAQAALAEPVRSPTAPPVKPVGPASSVRLPRRV